MTDFFNPLQTIVNGVLPISGSHAEAITTAILATAIVDADGSICSPAAAPRPQLLQPTAQELGSTFATVGAPTLPPNPNPPKFAQTTAQELGSPFAALTGPTVPPNPNPPK